MRIYDIYAYSSINKRIDNWLNYYYELLINYHNYYELLLRLTLCVSVSTDSYTTRDPDSY